MIPRKSTWTSSQRMLLFVFENYWPRPLGLVLAIGPGPEEIRQKLSKLAGNLPFLDAAEKGGKWISLYRRQPFLEELGEEDYQSLDMSSLQDLIAENWKQFLNNELPEIISAVKSQWSA